MGESLDECFKKFKIAHDLTNTREGLAHATLCVIRDFAKDNVVYVELRTTPKQNENMSKTEYLECVLESIRSARKEFPYIIVKLLPSIDRSQGIDSAKSTMDAILKLHKKFSDIIKGIDLSGNPNVENFSNYKLIFETFRNMNLPLSLHCGEVENEEEIREMIDFGMARCGHGTFIKESNLQKLIEKRIPVECCLSSNVKCGTVSTYDDHHFKYFLDNSHPVVICTDDFGVFDTTLSKEFIIAQKTFGLSKEQLFTLSKNAVLSSFASEEEKQSLMQMIENYFMK
ncbi:adenosine deaminase-like protein isoform X2 [Hermetia illucens]|nr:adenosine deaminase-like protein isoform X2 [Hermetia illucens]